VVELNQYIFYAVKLGLANYKHNKKMELTTKAEPILSKFKDLGGFCGSSFWRWTNIK